MFLLKKHLPPPIKVFPFYLIDKKWCYLKNSEIFSSSFFLGIMFLYFVIVVMDRKLQKYLGGSFFLVGFKSLCHPKNF